MYIIGRYEDNRDIVAATTSSAFGRKDERRLGMRAIAQRNNRGQVSVLTSQII